MFFCNSGAEANENALHLARRHTGRQTIVSVRGGWHGRTAATLACTDGPRYEEAARRAGMPLSRKVPFDDVAALDAAVDDTVAAVLVEPVQGFAGARDCSPEFLAAARRVCDERGAVLLFDEVQCGVGRCGAFSAAEAVGVTPDALTFAKGLARRPADRRGGRDVPRSPSRSPSAIWAARSAAGPVPCAAALANIAVIEREGLIANAVAVGEHLAARRRARSASGRCRAADCCWASTSSARRPRCSGRCSAGGSSPARPPIPHVLRLLPPLSFSTREADLLLAGLREVLA